MASPSPVDTSPSNYVNNCNQELQSYVDEDNQHAVERYQGAMANYNRFVDEEGLTPPGAVPSVPLAEALSDPDPITGLCTIVQTNAPACPAIAAHVPPMSNRTPKAPNVIDIGPQIGGKWYGVGARDSFPPGMITPPIPSADGTLHTYEKYAAPVGAGWYLQLT